MLLFAKCVGAPFEIDKKQKKKKDNENSKGEKSVEKKVEKEESF